MFKARHRYPHTAYPTPQGHHSHFDFPELALPKVSLGKMHTIASRLHPSRKLTTDDKS